MPVKLIKALPYIGTALVMSVVMLLLYGAGFKSAYHAQQAIIERMKQEQTAALLASSNAFAAELERVNAQRQTQAEATQQVGIKLAAADVEIGRLKQQYKKGINHAIEQDKSDAGDACIDGLGAHGLQQYRRAPGYVD